MYTITGAPRVVNGLVIIGNGGAEYGVRGYVTAYDAADRQAGLALLHRARRARVRTRKPISRRPKRPGRANIGRLGGGGTVWDAMAYDPAQRPALYRRRQWRALEPVAAALARRRRQSLHLVHRRDPARRPANMSGTTRKRRARPGTIPRPSTSCWPTSTIDGKPRKVLMQAPKNGFFYVHRPRHRAAHLGQQLCPG